MAKKSVEPSKDLALIRNIGVIAHIDAGKTTTTERILYYTGMQHRIGDVDDGTTTTDFKPDEQARGITINAAAVSCRWTARGKADYDINIIDTPGHVDFTAEVERSLRVLDGAIGVFCAVGGVEAQSETVWRQADSYQVPRIAFINKLDRSGADFEEAVTQLRDILGVTPAVIQIPIGAEREFVGVVDLIAMEAIYWRADTLGAELERSEIPPELAAIAVAAREALVDLVSEDDEEFMEKALSENLTPSDIRIKLRELTLSGNVTPVLCGTSLRNKGVQPLLDAICDYLPSPVDMPPVSGRAPKRKKRGKMDIREIADWTDETRRPALSESLSCLVFKSDSDKHGDLLYMRIYSGSLKQGQMVLNLTRGQKERVNKIFKLQGSRRTHIEVASAGDIVATVGLRYTRTGDTLCDQSDPILLEAISFPDTVMSRAVEPRSTADREKLLHALERLERDDPTFKTSEDAETGQLIISGMGELHLEILKNRIETVYKVEAKFKELRVAYRQAVIGPGRGHGKIARQGQTGRNLFAEVEIELRPCDHDVPGGRIPVLNRLEQEAVPREFWPAIEEGLRDAAQGSYAWGYPLTKVEATILSGKFDAADSSAEAFTAASSMAFEAAVGAAGIELLEPVMAFEVRTQAARMGDVVNDLGRRGAEIQSMAQVKGDASLIKGRVALAQMFGYAADVMSLTNGRGSFSMAPLAYEPVPESRRPKLF